MDFSPFQRMQGGHASHGPADDGYMFLLPTQVFSGKEDRGIAAGNRNVLLNRRPIARQAYASPQSRTLSNGVDQISIRRDCIRQDVADTGDGTNKHLRPNFGNFDAKRNGNALSLNGWRVTEKCALDHFIVFCEAKEVFDPTGQDGG